MTDKSHSPKFELVKKLNLMFRQVHAGSTSGYLSLHVYCRFALVGVFINIMLTFACPCDMFRYSIAYMLNFVCFSIFDKKKKVNVEFARL